MLVTLDCTELGQDSRNALFMSNRETFREDPLLSELFKKLQKELHDHEGLDSLNQKRYEEKIKNAVNDDDGINALEELLATDPTLAELFGSMTSGKVAAKTAANEPGGKILGAALPFQGKEFPSWQFACGRNGGVSWRNGASVVLNRRKKQLFHKVQTSGFVRICWSV